MEKSVIDRFFYLKEGHKANARKIRIRREGKEELAKAIGRGRTAKPRAAPGHVNVLAECHGLAVLMKAPSPGTPRCASWSRTRGGSGVRSRWPALPAIDRAAAITAV